MGRVLPITVGAVTAPLLLGSQPHLSGTTLTWFFLATAVLIVLNGVYVAYEFAILAAKQSVFTNGRLAGRRTSTAALTSMSDLSMQLAGAQLGITMASLGLGHVGEPAFANVIENLLGARFNPAPTELIGLVAALSIVVFLHLVLGEMVPKNIALAAPETTLRRLVLPYRAFLWLFRPFIKLLNGMANGGCRLLGVEPKDELVMSHSASELAAIVSQSGQEGTIQAEEALLLSGALHFAQQKVGGVARPLSDVTTLRLGATAAQAERLVTSSGRDRVPIVGPDSALVGYIHARDLFRVDPSRRLSPIPGEMVRRMAIVKAERSLIEVLRTMRQVRRQVAVVTENGQAVGVISVEEVIRALLRPSTADHPVPVAVATEPPLER